MSKAAKKSIWITAIALLLIGIAMWLRYISRSIDGTYGITQIRSGIYIILLSAWGYPFETVLFRCRYAVICWPYQD